MGYNLYIKHGDNIGANRVVLRQSCLYTLERDATCMNNSDILYQICVACLLVGAGADSQIEKDEWLHRAMVVSGMLEGSYADK
jgi:hypothetical protein